MSAVRSSREDHAAAGKRKLQEYRLKKQQEAEDRAKRTSQYPAATTRASEAFAATVEAESRFNAALSESLQPARPHSNGSPITQLSHVADQPSSQDIKRIEAQPQAVDLHTIAPTYELSSTPLPDFSSANTERPAQPAPFRVVENGIPFRDNRGSIDEVSDKQVDNWTTNGHLEHRLHTTVHSQANGSSFHHATSKSSGLPEDRSLPLQPQQNGEASYAGHSVSQMLDEHTSSFTSTSISQHGAPPPPPSKSDVVDERYTALIQAATTREAKYTELQEAYNKLQARALDAERSLQASAEASAQTLQALRESHAEELRSLQFQHAKLQNELETVQLQQKGLRTGLQKANEEKAALLRKIEDLTQSQAALQAQWPSSKVSEFNAEREHWQKERKQLEAELQAAFELRERSEEERRKAMALVAASKAQYDELSAERTALQRARDDMAAQLRVAKLRLQEAEEDQYKAEEDVGAMRAELERLTAALAAAENHASHASQAGRPSTSPYSEELLAMQQERDTAITELKSAIAVADAERKRASMLELRANAANDEMSRITQQVVQLNNELRQLKYELANASQAVEDERQRASVLQVQLEEAAIQRAAELPQQDAVSAQLRQELALLQEQLSATQMQHNASLQRLRDAELLVQRLSASHGKLLAEIDSQSLEIERLFSENAGLSKGIRDASEISVSWERQVEELISQNAALRAELADSRAKAAAAASVPKPVISSLSMLHAMELASDAARTSGSHENGSLADLQQAHAHLEAKYAEAQERAEALAAQCAELTAKYTATIQSFGSIERAYDPVLSTIEMRLVQMRREVSMYIEGTA